MATNAINGKAALDASDYTTAVTQFTIALKDTPTSPLWLISRSTAYQRLRQHDLALIDADNAVLAARARARRELIAQAQFRRAVALHGLKRYGDARLCLTWVRKLDEKMKALGMWTAKVVKDWEDAGGEEGNVVVVKEYPEKIQEAPSADAGVLKKETQIETENRLEEVKKFTTEEKGKMAEATITAVPTATLKEKIRHEFYQTAEKLTITVFARGVPKDKAEIIIKEGSLEISFPTESNSTFNLNFDPLFSAIDPSKSTFRITPHKIEIVLQKRAVGLKWASLEGNHTIRPLSPSLGEAVPAENVPIAIEKLPEYPTSSRNGPKDWDALAENILQGIDDVPEGERFKGTDEFAEEGGDAMNDFFRKIYKDADPDTKRAMMKSFQESNGTALSTNWAEVGKAPVKTQPPDGVEAKKWGA